MSALNGVLLGAKLMACRRCGQTGMLIGHGLLFGYAEHTSDRIVRGRRLLCSRRFGRSGCGHTFSILLSIVIAGFSVSTSTLSNMLQHVVNGLCRKAAWERIDTTGLCLRSGYRLWERLLGAQTHLRTALAERSPPPTCDDHRPLAQVFEHLKHALDTTRCLFANFQLSFQRDLFG